MAKDLTGDISERVRKQISDIVAGVEKMGSLGPHKEDLTPNEFRAKMAKLSPDERLAAARAFPGGEAEFLKFINGKA